MKKPFFTIAFCLALAAFWQQPAIAQSQETTEYDDLAPFPFDDENKPKEKKTIGEKLKATLNHENAELDTMAKKPKVEEYMRFYEFKDITFADREKEEMEYKPRTQYAEEDKEDTYTYRMEPYRDVTFGKDAGTTELEEKEFDDEPYMPYRMRVNKDDGEKENYYKEEDESDMEEKTPVKEVLKPIAIKDKDHYRQDYIYYYTQRKKKGNGNPENPVYFSNEINKTKKRILDRMDK